MKDITLVVIDFINHDLAKFSIEQTLKHIDAKDVLIVSDREILRGARHVLTDPIVTAKEYNEYMLKGITEHVSTNHALYIQWDGMAHDKKEWTDEFLDYDYIGAPWSWETPNRAIGNGGFSLRSKRLMDACKDISGNNNEDELIGKVHRPYLESIGIRFPDVELASRFSVEEQLPTTPNTFGFHGVWNVFYHLDDAVGELYATNLISDTWNERKWYHVITSLFHAKKHSLVEYMMARLKTESLEKYLNVEKELLLREYIN